MLSTLLGSEDVRRRSNSATPFASQRWTAQKAVCFVIDCPVGEFEATENPIVMRAQDEPGSLPPGGNGSSYWPTTGARCHFQRRCWSAPCLARPLGGIR